MATWRDAAPVCVSSGLILILILILIIIIILVIVIFAIFITIIIGIEWLRCATHGTCLCLVCPPTLWEVQACLKERPKKSERT